MDQNKSQQNISPWGACQYKHNSYSNKVSILQTQVPVLCLKHV